MSMQQARLAAKDAAKALVAAAAMDDAVQDV